LFSSPFLILWLEVIPQVYISVYKNYLYQMGIQTIVYLNNLLFSVVFHFSLYHIFPIAEVVALLTKISSLRDNGLTAQAVLVELVLDMLDAQGSGRAIDHHLEQQIKNVGWLGFKCLLLFWLRLDLSLIIFTGRLFCSLIFQHSVFIEFLRNQLAILTFLCSKIMLKRKKKLLLLEMFIDVFIDLLARNKSVLMSDLTKCSSLMSILFVRIFFYAIPLQRREQLLCLLARNKLLGFTWNFDCIRYIIYIHPKNKDGSPLPYIYVFSENKEIFPQFFYLSREITIPNNVYLYQAKRISPEAWYKKVVTKQIINKMAREPVNNKHALWDTRTNAVKRIDHIILTQISTDITLAVRDAIAGGDIYIIFPRF
ncbi:hypothetical protein ACJX0J_021845, partial [Zea mays]